MKTDNRLPALETLRLRLCSKNHSLDGAMTRESPEAIDRHIASLQPDGLWPDIVYRSDELKDWPADTHLSRVFAIITAWHDDSSPRKGEQALLTAALRGLDGWYAANPQSANWWWNQIGAPQSLGEILIRIKGHCDPSYIDRAIPAFICHEPAVRMTGQNLVWMAAIQIRHGILTDTPDRTAMGFLLIKQALHIFPSEEGIQPDMSFHQHGKLFYSGGYGQGFASDVARFVWLAQDTPFAWPDFKIDLLTRYLLDGSRWMVRGRTFDYGACGREITRQGHSASRLFQSIAYMAEVKQPRQAEVAAMHARAMEPGLSHVTGNRYFWYSDFMAHHRPEFSMSVRLTSNRIENADWPCCGGEGRYCHHMAEGATFLMRDGDEYRDLFPVWNWRQIPGTTVEQLPGNFDPDALRGFGEKEFCGGVSDGHNGCAAMDFRRKTLSAKKAYFLFDNALVALGTAISSTGAAPVITTINQSHRRGPVQIGKNAPLPDGTHALIEGTAIWHDGFTYRILTGKGTLTLAMQSGSWAACGVGSDTVQTLPVFNAQLDHGTHPDNASYAYAVTSAPIFPEISDAARFEILHNTPTLQAVWDGRDQCGQAVFYTPGNVRFPDGQGVSVDRHCFLLYHSDATGQAVITLAETERQAGIVTLTLAGRRNARLGVSLPQEEMAGSSTRILVG